MVTPYDFQEGIGHRAAYVEARLAAGTPVVMASIDEGILAVTLSRQARKLYEIYDRLMLGAIGQQSDVEAVRIAALDFAHQEGYQRSEQDVTIARVVSAIGQPLKKAFGDFNASPFVVRALFAEVGSEPSRDIYYLLDYDGDYSIRRHTVYLGGNEEADQSLKASLEELKFEEIDTETGIEQLKPVLARAMDPAGKRPMEEVFEGRKLEVALLSRRDGRERRFELLTEES